MINIWQINNELYINGDKVEVPKSILFKNCVCQINDKLYVNGKEKIKGKWKYTIRSIWHTLF